MSVGLSTWVPEEVAQGERGGSGLGQEFRQGWPVPQVRGVIAHWARRGNFSHWDRPQKASLEGLADGYPKLQQEWEGPGLGRR